MPINSVCIKCGTELKLGKFAYQQSLCFDCYKDEFFDILETLPISISQRQVLTHPFMVMQELYARTKAL